MTTRREFIGCGAAFAAAPFIPNAAMAAAKDGLRLRFGVMADIHINEIPWSQKKWPAALKWFDKQGADAIMVCGDMADYGVEAELQRVNLYRDSMNLYVNGTRYPLRRAARGVALQQASGLEPAVAGGQPDLEQCEGAVDGLFQQASMLSAQIRTHLFASTQVQQTVAGQMETFKRQIAQLRADVRRLLYDE